MGAGYHGGFGATKGNSKTKIVGYIRGKQVVLDKLQLIAGISGVTKQASDIVDNIKNKKIRLTILGDDLFEKYLGVSAETAAYTVDNHMYLRMSTLNGLSDLIHEGTHAMDHISGRSRKNTLISNEIRAYKKEHEFQKAAGIKLDFKDEDEIRIHVYLNYYKKER